MKLDIIPLGLYQENTYVLHEKGHVLIIDPGAKAKNISSRIESDEIVDAILITHGHKDHTLSTDDLAEEYGCPVYMDVKDLLLTDPTDRRKNPMYFLSIYSKILPLEEDMKVGIFKLHVYQTPGHSEGSVCIRIQNLLFTGDTLFAGSCGRTDLFGGDPSEMTKSLNFLATLPGDLVVYPGHGPATTIAHEVMNNPFVRGLMF